MSGASTRSQHVLIQPTNEPASESEASWLTNPAEPRQELLPPLRWLLQPDINRFAHPAEVELARLLTFYGIRWSYEPTTFAVRWGSDGQPQEFVTPDFYLPEHDCYLELTTMRQRLVTRKNRKFRKLRECYPNVRVRILYLRDFKRLAVTYGPADSERKGTLGDVVFSAQELESRIAEIAAQLVDELTERGALDGGQRPLLLGVGKGSRTFLAHLSDGVRALGIPVDLDRIELTSLTEHAAGSRVKVLRAPHVPAAGRNVVVVQEVVSSGLSAAFLDTWLRRHRASGVAFCALLDREEARIVDVPLSCRGFLAPDVPLAGYGLARWKNFRDLPDIVEVASDPE